MDIRLSAESSPRAVLRDTSSLRNRRGLRRNGNTVLFVLAVLVVMVGVVGAIAYFFINNQSDDTELPLMASATLASYDHVVLEQGEVESSNPVEVKCRVKSRGGGSNPSTKIIWVIPEGSVVKEGDKLVELDSAALKEERSAQNIRKLASEALVIQAKAVLDTAKIAEKEYLEGTYEQERQTIQNEIFLAEENLRKAQLAYESTQRSVARGFLTALQLEGEQFRVNAARNELQLAQSKLTVLEKYTKEKMLTQLRSDIEAAEVSYQNEQGVLEEEIKKLAEIDEQISFCTVNAPTAGQVVYANVRSSRSGNEFVVEEGAAVRENQVLIRLPDPNEMQVKANINESRIGLVRTGMPVSVRIDAFGENTLHGEVTKVNKYPEPGNWWSSSAKQYATLIKIHDPPPEIRSGLTAEVRIHVNHIDQALQIPVQALYEHKGRTFCLVRNGETYDTRRITMISTNDKVVAVDTEQSDPLRADEQVVINPRQHTGKFDFSRFTDLPSDEEWAQRNAGRRGDTIASSGPSGETPGEGVPGQDGAPAAASKAGAGGQAAAGGGARGGSPTEVFQRLDSDGDGSLSSDELAAMGGFGERLQSGDANGDGAIDQSEFTAKIGELRAARQAQATAGGSGGGE